MSGSSASFLPAAKKPRPRGYKRKRAALMLGGSAMIVGAQSTGAFSQSQVSAPLPDSVQSAPVEAARLPAEALNPSDELLDAIVEEEGLKLTVYSSVIGNPLVGAGHLVLPSDGLQVGDTISHERAMQFLKADTDRAAEGVRDLVGDLPLYQNEFDALVDLVYNVGIGKVSLAESPKLNAAIAAGDYEAMAEQLDYSSAAGKVFGGLEHRSDRRAQIFALGLYDNTRV
ncbi:lysozyme [Qipengyuania sp. DSG2-2]|uniref:lysozyme n=1 Tax=Qipengyuania sp. DGS2-2 TaxID=3349631 RepID=UPI0036D43A32